MTVVSANQDKIFIVENWSEQWLLWVPVKIKQERISFQVGETLIIVWLHGLHGMCDLEYLNDYYVLHENILSPSSSSNNCYNNNLFKLMLVYTKLLEHIGKGVLLTPWNGLNSCRLPRN